MEGKIMSNFNEESIITRIEELLKQRNWSIYKLAQEAGISYPTLSNALNLEPLTTKVASVLALTINYLSPHHILFRHIQHF